MGFKDTILKAYNGIVKRNTNTDKVEYDFGLISDLDEVKNSTEEQEHSLLTQIDPEMKNYISDLGRRKDAENSLIPPKVIPVHFLTDTPTATDVLTLLGMIRWAMEKSSKNGEEYSFNVKIRNRNESPFLVGMGDVSVPRVAVQDCVEIGN